MAANLSLVERARKGIEDFLKGRNGLSSDLRTKLRDVPDFLPQSACVSAAVTCHILTSTQNNIRCLYHIHNRRPPISDLDVAAATEKTNMGEPSLTGVAGLWVMKKTERILPRGENLVEDSDGELPFEHLDCGCSVKDAVFHYWLWKNWRLVGMEGTVTEPTNAAHMTPRMRNVIHQGMRKWGGFKMDSLFQSPPALAPILETREQMIEGQLKRLITDLGRVYRNKGVALDVDTLLEILREVPAAFRNPGEPANRASSSCAPSARDSSSEVASSG